MKFKYIDIDGRRHAMLRIPDWNEHVESHSLEVERRG